jgi:hypothetical protein
MDRGGSTILPAINQSMSVDRNGEPLDVKIIKARDLDELSEIHLDDRRVSLLPTSE